MTNKETTNIIIMLRRMGLSGDEIVDFLGFIETHNPTEEELEETKKESIAKN